MKDNKFAIKKAQSLYLHKQKLQEEKEESKQNWLKIDNEVNFYKFLSDNEDE